jgi:hypothetical protein
MCLGAPFEIGLSTSKIRTPLRQLGMRENAFENSENQRFGGCNRAQGKR